MTSYELANDERPAVAVTNDELRIPFQTSRFLLLLTVNCLLLTNLLQKTKGMILVVGAGQQFFYARKRLIWTYANQCIDEPNR